MKKLSVVVPCYNEEESLPFFYDKINEVTNSLKHELITEFIFVDDGSKDKTLKILSDYRKKDSRVNFISFSRNFGKESAIYAGLQHASGDYVVLMDADLQDPPELIEEMYTTIINSGGGYDCVATRRVSRKGEPPIRSLFAKLFYKVINKLSKIEIVDGARDFRLMTRKFVDSVLKLSEYNRFSKGLFAWVGFGVKYIEFENVKRVAGQTKWSFFKLLFYSFEGITAFSTVPLFVSSFFGLAMCGVSIIILFFLIIRTFIFGNAVQGWTSLATILVFVSGLQLFFFGVLGQYIAKMYLEIKRRPIYLISEASQSDWSCQYEQKK